MAGATGPAGREGGWSLRHHCSVAYRMPDGYLPRCVRKDSHYFRYWTSLLRQAARPGQGQACARLAERRQKSVRYSYAGSRDKVKQGKTSSNRPDRRRAAMMGGLEPRHRFHTTSFPPSNNHTSQCFQYSPVSDSAALDGYSIRSRITKKYSEP